VQYCNDAMCTTDKDVPVAATLTIVAAGAAPRRIPIVADPAPVPKEPAGDAEQGLAKILLSGIGWDSSRS